MPFTTLKEAFEPLMPAVLMAAFGSIAKFCLGKNHTIRQLISGLIVSAFSGSIAALFLVDTQLSFYTKTALGGMAGYMGGWLLDVIAGRLAKTVESVPLPTERKE